MPIYEYDCADHGAFAALRPLAEYAQPCPCPDCGAPAARVLITAPRLGSSRRDGLAAHAVNERAADSPKRLSQHGPGCGCCAAKAKPGRTLTRPDGAKAFPSQRPWMISH